MFVYTHGLARTVHRHELLLTWFLVDIKHLRIQFSGVAPMLCFPSSCQRRRPAPPAAQIGSTPLPDSPANESVRLRPALKYPITRLPTSQLLHPTTRPYHVILGNHNRSCDLQTDTPSSAGSITPTSPVHNSNVNSHAVTAAAPSSALATCSNSNQVNGCDKLSMSSSYDNAQHLNKTLMKLISRTPRLTSAIRWLPFH